MESLTQWSFDSMYQQTGDLLNQGSAFFQYGDDKAPSKTSQEVVPSSDKANQSSAYFQKGGAAKVSPTQHGIIVHLLAKHGKVVFLECADDFVELLMDLLNKPAGAFLGIVDNGPLANLSESIASLSRGTRGGPNEYFHSKPINIHAMLNEVSSAPYCSHLTEVTPGRIDGTEDDGATNGCHQPVCSNVTVIGKCPCSLTSHASSFSAMAVFTGYDGDVLDMTVKFPIEPDIMIGFAPKDLVVSQLGKPAIFLRCGFYVYCENARLTLYGQDGTIHKPSGIAVPSIALRLRFMGGIKPAMRCAVDYGEFIALSFESEIPGNLQYCPVVTFGKVNQTCTIAGISTSAEAQVRPFEKEMMPKPMKTFMISNSLEICDSSSSNTLELMKRYKVEKADLEKSSAVATPQHVNLMLSRALLGHRDSLLYAFSDSWEDEPAEKHTNPAPVKNNAQPRINVEKSTSHAAAATFFSESSGEKTGAAQIGTTSMAVKPDETSTGETQTMSTNQLLSLVDALLANQTAMDKTTAKCWKDFAEYDDMEGRPALDLESAERMNLALTKEFGLPESFFADVDELFTRFDFNGNRLLDKKECVKMYRFATIQKRRLIGGRSEHFDIPTASLEDKGYTMVRKLGEGGQGSMHLATRVGSKKKYCIKCYDKATDEASGGIDAIIDEFQLMEELEHINVCRTYEMFQSVSHYYLVNEPYFGGDLTKLYGKISEKRVEANELWWRNIFRQILSGLEYLHSQAIVHCDIKEPNVMIALDDKFKDPRPVLIDLGLAQFFADSNDSGGCGTTGYIPPEVWDRGFWSPRGDIFSLGIVFFQLLANRIPSVPNDDMQGILQVGDVDDDVAMAKLARSPLPWNEFPGNMPELKQLIEWMTSQDELQRPRVPQCSEHEWFHCGSNASWKLDQGKSGVLSWFK